MKEKINLNNELFSDELYYKCIEVLSKELKRVLFLCRRGLLKYSEATYLFDNIIFDSVEPCAFRDYYVFDETTQKIVHKQHTYCDIKKHFLLME